MASTLPPVKGAAFSFEIALVSQGDTDIFQTSVTLAATDVQVSKDGGAFSNITSLPTEIGTSGVLIVALSTDEMNADRVAVRFHDSAGDEWQDAMVTIYTGGQTLDTIEGLVDDLETRLTAARAGYLDNINNAGLATTVAQTGDSYARIGAAGASLTALGDARLANLDATVSSRSSLTAADVWSYATRTLTSLSALVSSIAAAVWAYATRTLTSTAAATTEAVSGSTLTITAATTYSATLTGLTIPADWLDMWFTVKDDDSKTDAQAIIQVHKSNPSDAANDGLVYLNGAAGTKADGSLTVDQAGGTVAISIAATSTDDLDRASAMGYDVKVQSTAAGVTLLTAGVCNVELTETKTID